jgi:type II secretory pathway pseudopilin PulG
MPSVVSMRLFIAICLALVIILGGGNLVATFLQNHQVARQLQSQQQQFERQLQAQQRQQAAQQRKISLEIDSKLCTSFGKLAALKPPGGAAASNPSRLYEQKQHDILAGLGTDIGCTVVANAGG